MQAYHFPCKGLTLEITLENGSLESSAVFAYLYQNTKTKTKRKIQKK